MSTLLVNYDLINPGQDYSKVDAYLKTYSWAHVLESTWAISTTKSVTTVRDELATITDKNDKFYVVDITNDSAAWIHLPADVSKWLQEHQ